MYPALVARPRTRGECLSEERPCPFVSCKFHLYLDALATGTLKLNWPEHEPDQIPQTCVLDVADRGGSTLEEVAEVFNMTRERVRQIEEDALRKIGPVIRKIAA